MIKINSLIVALFCLSQLTGWSQRMDEMIEGNNIRTVQLYKEGWELSLPVIQLGSDEKLVLSFDELGDDAKHYYYTLQHCSSDWQLSPLVQAEYLKGFTHTPIDDYRFSLNTTFSYVHYKAVFPNDDVSVLLSGNYIVKVYEDFNDSQPVIIKHFMVVEPLVMIDANIRYPIEPALQKKYQQVDLRILHPNLIINNPAQEVKVVVMQNGRIDNMVTNLKPDFIRPNELVYDRPSTLLFEGGHQYRWLDIRSSRFLAENVQKVVYSNPYYHVELFPDAIRSNQPFFFKDDSNGQYVVSVREYDDADIEADYLFVHFSLPVQLPYLDGHVYVLGALTNRELNQANEMTYNGETQAYELNLLLKQGFYNYLYAFVPYKSRVGNLSKLEGAFVETENDYNIFVYYKTPSDYYERLIGYSVANSRK